jgi:hypothetical protein
LGWPLGGGLAVTPVVLADHLLEEFSELLGWRRVGIKGMN